MAISNLQDKLGLNRRIKDVDRQLDDAVADSFPASDPVSLAQPHDPEELGIRRSMVSPAAWLVLGGALLALLAAIALRR